MGTLKVLAVKYNKSISTIQRKINAYETNLKPLVMPQEPINLVFDAFYLKRGYGWLVFRANGKTIHYSKICYESIDTIAANLRCLDRLGYKYKSITITVGNGF